MSKEGYITARQIMKNSRPVCKKRRRSEKHTGITNRRAGELLGNISYSAVAKAYWRFSEKLKKDKALRKKVAGIMSNVKG